MRMSQKQESSQEDDPNPEITEKDHLMIPDGWTMKNHYQKFTNARKEKVKDIFHWFGNSSSDDTDTDNGDLENWDTVAREQRNEDKKRRKRERHEKSKKELNMKARRMAGLGPITSNDIEQQRKNTKDYNQAKIWAVKKHLATFYKYNQEELDQLEILETKRNAKEDIVYVAVAEERDIKDMYTRKAECRSDDTNIRSYIPPQYWARFTALNRILRQQKRGRRQAQNADKIRRK